MKLKDIWPFVLGILVVVIWLTYGPKPSPSNPIRPSMPMHGLKKLGWHYGLGNGYVLEYKDREHLIIDGGTGITMALTPEDTTPSFPVPAEHFDEPTK